MSTFTRTQQSYWKMVYTALYQQHVPLVAAKPSDWISAIARVDVSEEPLWEQVFHTDTSTLAHQLLTCVLSGINEFLVELCGPGVTEHFPATYWEVNGMIHHDPASYLTTDGFSEFICLAINTAYMSILDDWGMLDTGSIMAFRSIYNPIPLSNVIIRGCDPDSEYPENMDGVMPELWPPAPFGFFHILSFYIATVYISIASHPWGPTDGIKISYYPGDEPMTLVAGLRRVLTTVEFRKVNRRLAARRIQKAERHRQYRSLMKTLWRVLHSKNVTKGLLDHVKQYLHNK